MKGQDKSGLAQLRQALGEETRAALIDAATRVFIESGYRAARVQAIAAAAGTRLSAINYHFGGKEGLYRAVLQSHADRAIRQSPLPQPDAADPRASLEAGVRMIARRFVDAGAGCRIGELLLRELMNPTEALDWLVERFAQPQSALFRPLIRAVLGPQASDETVSRAMFSIVSQCLAYVMARPMMLRLAPEVLAGEAVVERMTAHVTAFSWGGLMALRAALAANDGGEMQ